MESIEDDPRFSHVASDPRFKPMPKSKRKVKIDSRFQSLFTSKHFSHRTDIDKRGKPVVNSAKKNKHVMERFYQLSDNDSDTDDDSDAEDKSDIEETRGGSELKETRDMCGKQPKTATGKSASVSKNELSKKEVVSKAKVKKRKLPEQVKNTIVPVKKRSVSALNGESDTLARQNQHTVTEFNESDEDELDDSEDEASEESDKESEEDNEEQEELPQYTEEFELEETNIDHRWNELHTDAVEVSESTHRLAVCNMDWDFVKAQDLFVLFKSFVPEGGRVISVTIYPSEFGKERMAEEARLGPKEMRKSACDDEGDKKDSMKTGGKKKKKGKNVIDQQKVKRNDKEKAAAQQEKLREYQLNRLRYYYAVVDCDSVQTADVIYNECDGREYQLSSVRLDLRFIPEHMTFDDEPHDVFSAEQNIMDYQPNTFNSTALCQAKVEVTWDETEFDRLSQRIRTLQQKELESIVEENKYADIIAPPESDSEDEEGRPEWLKTALDDEEQDEDDKELTEEAKIKLYRKVLMEKLAEEEEEKKKEEGDVDQEMQWQPGLKTSVEKKMKRKEKDSSVVGEYLEKKKTKKKLKKAERLEENKKKLKPAEEDDQAFSDDELPEGLDVSDLFGTENDKVICKLDKKKRKKNKKGRDENIDEEMDENEQAELELMLMGDDNDKSLAKPEEVKEAKSKSSKKKKKKVAMQKKKAAQETEDFELDVNDDRFSALYTSHLYHIDPTAPQFKKTKNMERLVDEQIKRKNKSAKKLKSKEQGIDEKDSVNVSEVVMDSQAVSKKLVESLKRKMKKI